MKFQIDSVPTQLLKGEHGPLAMNWHKPFSHRQVIKFQHNTSTATKLNISPVFVIHQELTKQFIAVILGDIVLSSLNSMPGASICW